MPEGKDLVLIPARGLYAGAREGNLPAMGQPLHIDRGNIHRDPIPHPIRIPSDAIPEAERWLSMHVGHCILIGRSAESGVLEWRVELWSEGIPLSGSGAYGDDLAELIRGEIADYQAFDDEYHGRTPEAQNPDHG